MDLIRELLLKLEALPLQPRDVAYIYSDLVPVDGYDERQIDYHLQLLEQAGLIDTGGYGEGAGPGIAFSRLSWAGHDFLDAIRSPDVWDRTTRAATAAGGFTVELLMFAAKTYLEGKIKGVIGG
ncbi:DUF2513 domain-containing protein [Burkholderia sp. BCC1972]|uniref:DUF2513 domain-containing protein n=1 Tax=Burkholderia sp. BCC1972 TaxID=2817438 RepID=UPI002ABD21B0|nr:DUF2513 domain-containing protein [Burkholderia sp. BCC1972]